MAVRPAHAIDGEALDAFMAGNVAAFRGPGVLREFRGGQSNPTYLIEAPSGRYVLRRKPPGRLLASAHAIDREYRVISALGKCGLPVPRTFALCDDETVIGSPFFVMDYVGGTVFWESTLPDLSADARRRVYGAMNAAIAGLHGVDIKAAGLDDFGRHENYVARQISRWSRQYRASAREKIEAMEKLIDWLPANLPDADECAVVHGDFRLDNLIFDPATLEVAAILDWELSTLGHPASDFAYHCLPFRLPPSLFNGLKGLDLAAFGIPDEAAYIKAYCRATGRQAMPDQDYYVVFNLFRLAAIAEGIMGRIAAGTATSQHAREMGAKARPLAETAWEMAERMG